MKLPTKAAFTDWVQRHAVAILICQVAIAAIIILAVAFKSNRTATEVGEGSTLKLRQKKAIVRQLEQEKGRRKALEKKVDSVKVAQIRHDVLATEAQKQDSTAYAQYEKASDYRTASVRDLTRILTDYKPAPLSDSL